ncbi:MAG TPA: hypothetical protein VFI96_01585, partial [Longimicrobiaceae bacterium]|nr:hypothetical protein [Longimicrobiaceae bacterium]
SPILFVMMAIAVVYALRRRSPLEWLLAVVSVVVFALFVYSALHKRVEANWPAPTYVSAIVLLCVHRWGQRGRRWLTGGVVLAGLLSAVIYADAVAPVLPVPARKDPVARAFGWEAMTDAALHAARAPHAPSARSWLGAERYQNASELAFHADDRGVFALNLTGRANQFDLWPSFPERASAGDRLVLALNADDEQKKGTPEVVSLLEPYFRDVRRGALVIRRRGEGAIGRVRIYSLDGWLGEWPERQEESR